MDSNKTKLKSLRAIIDEIDETKKPIARSLYEELIFMDQAMEELKDHVEEHGPIEYFKQGKQAFWKESAGSQVYLKYNRNFNQTLKQLSELLPEDKQEETDELLKFVMGNN